MDTIKSKSNEKVKYIKSLNEKKFRQKYMAYYLEGIKVVNEILDSNKAIDIMFIAYSKQLLEKVNGGKEILERLEKNKNSLNNIQIIHLSHDIFEYITDTKTPQGILAVVKIHEESLDEFNLELKDNIEKENKENKNKNKYKQKQKNTNNNILILDKIQDAGNIGTILRSAESFDINMVICIEGTTDVYSPKVTRATMGSLARENIIYVKTNEVEKLFNILKTNGYKIYATTLSNKSQFVEDFKFSNFQAYVMGNEANGVSDDITKMCDGEIKIRMSEKQESLNVAVATSIILYEQYVANKK